MRLAAEANKDLNAEIEDLREIVFTDRTEAIKNLKAEAIKEFELRLKEKSGCIVARRDGVELYTTKLYQIRATDIDNLVAEMTEGE